MRYAETQRLRGSVLVRCAHTDLGDAGERASGYFSTPWDWPRIKANQDWIGIFHSADDPLIPVSEARFVAARLGASYFESADRGHFIDDRTFPKWSSSSAASSDAEPPAVLPNPHRLPTR